MKHSLSPALVKFVYSPLLLTAVAFSVYSFVKPGLSTPIHPTSKIYEHLKQLNNKKIVTSSMTTLENDSTDRKPSPLYTYTFQDGSELKTVMVRIKKRDEFKIETYGLLTKSFDPIYIRSPIPSDLSPYSAVGDINSREAIQTCIVQGTNRLDQADIRLQVLTSAVESLDPTPSNFIYKKLFGETNPLDYSCLVITYFPKQSVVDPNKVSIIKNKYELEEWKTLVKTVQAAIAQD